MTLVFKYVKDKFLVNYLKALTMRNLLYVVSIFSILGTFPLKAGLPEEGWEPMAPLRPGKSVEYWKQKSAENPKKYKMIGNIVWKKRSKENSSKEA